MTPLDNLRRIAAGWRGEWRVDAHAGVTLSHDGDEWPIASMDGDVMIALVELLNAIRPAVDGATAEIARLTAELADLRAQVHAEARSHAATRADLAVAVHELGEVTRAYHVANDAIGEVCRLVGAESTPGAADVAGNDASRKRDAVAKVQALVEASKPATVDITAAIKSVERIESNSKALDYSADYMAAIERVLSCLRAVAENGGPLTSAVDGGTSQPATVGGLLATAPVGSIVEWRVTCPDGWMRAIAGDRRPMGARYLMSDNGGGCWSKHTYAMMLDHLRAPGRLVPAHLADADPATRGPIGEVPDAR